MATLKLKYVKDYRDRTGRQRYYFRRRGSKSVTLPGLPGSTEFREAYELALCDAPPIEIGGSRTTPGTIDALIVSYYKSTAWTELSQVTRDQRARIIEKFRQAYGKKRVALVQTVHLAAILGKIAKQSAKIAWVKAIRGLLAAAMPALRRDNPADGLKAGRMPKTTGFHQWSDEEVAAYRAYWPRGTQQRLALEIGAEALSRRCEIVQLGPQHVKNGRIEIARAKGSNGVNIRMSPELAAAVDAMPKDHLCWFVTKFGQPRTIMGLGDAFPKWATEAGLPAHCRLHGLKKWGMSKRAEKGCTTHEIMADSGHRTLGMIQKYTEKFDRMQASDRAYAKLRGNESV